MTRFFYYDGFIIGLKSRQGKGETELNCLLVQVIKAETFPGRSEQWSSHELVHKKKQALNL